MKKLFDFANKRTMAEFRRELARAHLLIAMMAVIIIMLVSIGTSQLATVDARLSAVCIALLTIVTAISLYMSVSLSQKKS